MKRLLLLALALLYGALALSAQTRYIRDERHAGLAVTVGSTSLVYFGAHQLPVPGAIASTYSPAAPADASMEVSWKWAPPDGTSPRTIRVALERRPGQSIPSWARDFREAVDAMLELYPPNVGTSAGIVAGGGGPGTPASPFGSLAIETGVTLDVSWKHDPDKGADGSNGPLEPVTVRAAVEKRDGESSREAARRLSQVVEALQEAFPPNVPEASGG